VELNERGKRVRGKPDTSISRQSARSKSRHIDQRTPELRSIWTCRLVLTSGIVAQPFYNATTIPQWSENVTGVQGLRERFNRAPVTAVGSNCRFVKQEQWERWRAKRKWVSGSKHRPFPLRGSEVLTPEKFRDFVWKILQSSAFWPENDLQCRP